MRTERVFAPLGEKLVSVGEEDGIQRTECWLGRHLGDLKFADVVVAHQRGSLAGEVVRVGTGFGDAFEFTGLVDYEVEAEGVNTVIVRCRKPDTRMHGDVGSEADAVSCATRS